MKKLLIALLLAGGAVGFVPKAEAGQYVKIWNGHGYTYVNKYDPGHNPAPRQRNMYNYGPARRYYAQPERHNQGYNDRNRWGRHNNNSRPRFSVDFGF